MANTIAILHLSDLHLTSKNRNVTDPILYSMVDDIKDRIDKLGFDEVIIAFTGDLSFSGKEDDYSLVREFVLRIENKISPTRMIFAAGNHDVDWEIQKRTASSDLLMKLLMRSNGGIEAISEVEESYKKEVENYKAVMKEFYSFLRDRKTPFIHNDDLYYVDSIDFGGKCFNFISLNSAYLFSSDHNYFGYLGQTQMLNAFSEASSRTEEKDYINVTMFHHPFRAIVPEVQNRTEDFIIARSDIILNGHVHSPGVYVAYTGSLLGTRRNKNPAIITQARCVFEEENISTVTPGYYILSFEISADPLRKLKIWEVQFDTNTGEWFASDAKNTYPLTLQLTSGRDNRNQIDVAINEFTSFDYKLKELEELSASLKMTVECERWNKEDMLREISIALQEALAVATSITNSPTDGLYANLMEYDQANNALHITKVFGTYHRWGFRRSFSLSDKVKGGTAAIAFKTRKIFIVPDTSVSEDVSWAYYQEKRILKGIINIPIWSESVSNSVSMVISIGSPLAGIFRGETIEENAHKLQLCCNQILDVRQEVLQQLIS
jgi:calcineurin-like phosphoesterase family protein